MDSANDHQEADQPQLNDFGKLTAKFLHYGQNASGNLSQVFSDMTIQGWVRLIAIVGGYLLIRPYAQKYLGKKKLESMEEDERKEKKEKAALSPNELREGQNRAMAQEILKEDDGDGSATDWGTKARIRQRVMIKQLIDAEEKRKQEEAEADDDRDIADLLED